jgi:hypothetical protein
MSTNDVPGANAANGDELGMGCWAEHEDGSLIFVESTEDDRVIYSVFDMATDPIVEYRDSMAIGSFKKTFTWDAKKSKADKWTWHDKTPFPWDRIIRAGAKDGTRFTHADDLETAAQRVRKSREIRRGKPVDEREVESRVDRLGEKADRIIKKLQKAVNRLRP